MVNVGLFYVIACYVLGNACLDMWKLALARQRLNVVACRIILCKDHINQLFTGINTSINNVSIPVRQCLNTSLTSSLASCKIQKSLKKSNISIFLIQPLNVVPHECVKPFKIQAAPRLAMSRAELVELLYKQHGLKYVWNIFFAAKVKI